jgi:hypothetical protein
MDLFKLPHTTKVHRVIPKNAFDEYTNAKQKKLFSDLVSRITWLNKLSTNTVNLESKEIKEIQLFKVELKVKEEVQAILNIIDKAIPYNIIFIVEYGVENYLSTSTKHPHPVNENNAVIDWTFKTDWYKIDENNYQLRLKRDLDYVFYDFCIQLSKKPELYNLSIQEVVQFEQRKDLLEKQILQLKKSIKACKQYKDKVELNVLMNGKIKELQILESSSK